MPFIHRRVFYGKAGAADQLVQHMQEANEAMARFGSDMNPRILTDHMTGRSDRVVVEWEMDNIGSMDDSMSGLMSNPEAAAFFGPWMEKLNSLIHYAEGDIWSIR